MVVAWFFMWRGGCCQDGIIREIIFTLSIRDRLEIGSTSEFALGCIRQVNASGGYTQRQILYTRHSAKVTRKG